MSDSDCSNCGDYKCKFKLEDNTKNYEYWLEKFRFVNSQNSITLPNEFLELLKGFKTYIEETYLHLSIDYSSLLSKIYSDYNYNIHFIAFDSKLNNHIFYKIKFINLSGTIYFKGTNNYVDWHDITPDLLFSELLEVLEVLNTENKLLINHPKNLHP